MIRYICDRCKRDIHTDEEMRFIVRLEIEAAIDPNDLPPELEDDHDHLCDVDEVLDRMDNQYEELDPAEIFQRRHFDLCTHCYRQFVKNPLGKDTHVPFGFSDN